MQARNSMVLLTLAAAGLGSMACSSSDSEDIRTSGMYANYTAVSDGASTRVTATLRVGGPTSTNFVKLSSGDSLVASSGSESQTLTETHLLEIYSYVGTLSVNAEGSVINFNFDRSAADEDAPNSNVTLPAEFSISAPTGGDQSRAQALTVTWAPSGSSDTMTVSVDGDCLRHRTFDVTGDPGTFTLNAGQVEPLNSGSTGSSCSATIAVARRRNGSVDPAFGEGGLITGTQARTVSIRSIP